MSLIVVAPAARRRVRRIPSGLWTPAKLFEAGQDGFWFDFSDLSTLWQDTSATTAVTANGDPIGRVNDKSGNGHNATQGTASAKPTYADTDGQYASYDGGDVLTISGSASSLAWLHKDGGIFMGGAARFGTGSNPDTFYGLMGNNQAATDNIGVVFRYDDRSAFSFDDKLRCIITRGINGQPTYQFDSANSVLTPNTDVTVFVNCPSGGPLEAYVDNSSVGTDAKDNGASGSNATYDLQIGAIGNDIGKLTGRIYETLVRDAVLTSAELTLLHDYWSAKYAP